MIAVAVAGLGSCSNPLQIAPERGCQLIDQYVAEFNAHDEEVYVQKFPDTEAAAFMKENVPVFECPDKELEKTY